MILNEGTGLCMWSWAASRLFRNIRLLFFKSFPFKHTWDLNAVLPPFMTHLCTKVGDITPVKVFWIYEFMWKQKKKKKKQLKESLCCLLSTPERFSANNFWPLWGEHVAVSSNNKRPGVWGEKVDLRTRLGKKSLASPQSECPLWTS